MCHSQSRQIWRALKRDKDPVVWYFLIFYIYHHCRPFRDNKSVPNRTLKLLKKCWKMFHSQNRNISNPWRIQFRYTNSNCDWKSISWRASPMRKRKQYEEKNLTVIVFRGLHCTYKVNLLEDRVHDSCATKIAYRAVFKKLFL